MTRETVQREIPRCLASAAVVLTDDWGMSDAKAHPTGYQTAQSFANPSLAGEEPVIILAGWLCLGL